VHFGGLFASIMALSSGLLLAASGAQAQEQTNAPPVAITGEQARATALQAYPGTALEADLDRVNGRVVWEVKLLPQDGGPAVEVRVDAATGALVEAHRDDDAGNIRPTPVAAPAFQEDFGIQGRTLADAGQARYFVLQPGYQLVLGDEDTRLTVTVLDETRDIGGTSTRVVEERQETSGELTEVARNFFAIDPATGDALYFGEEVDTYEAGVLVGHPGSWTATDGNRPGLIMPGTPVAGMRYYQEVAPGVAQDRAEILSTTETCSTPAGEFVDCVVSHESSPLETAVERKAYAPDIGLIQDEDLRLISAGYVVAGP
jgi:hypothetical protein